MARLQYNYPLNALQMYFDATGVPIVSLAENPDSTYTSFTILSTNH